MNHQTELPKHLPERHLIPLADVKMARSREHVRSTGGAHRHAFRPGPQATDVLQQFRNAAVGEHERVTAGLLPVASGLHERI